LENRNGAAAASEKKRKARRGLPVAQKPQLDLL
jgi:hypothetical protein